MNLRSHSPAYFPGCPRTSGRRRVRVVPAPVPRGFTLIELLVVVAIVAILTGAVVLNLDFRNAGSAVRDLSRRTGLLMEMASDQAVYSRQQLGIRFHPESYTFFILSEPDKKGKQKWTVLEDERLRFKEQSIPVEFQVDLSGQPIVLGELSEEREEADAENPLKPHVLFLSNGEIMPDFRVVASDFDAEYRYEITTGEVQPLIVEQLE